MFPTRTEPVSGHGCRIRVWWGGLLFIASCFLSSPHANAEGVSTNVDVYAYAIAIKGGISLGSYEAGMNWFLVERLRHRSRELGREGLLRVVAGASAGGINAIVSAMRICSAEDGLDASGRSSLALDNLFFQVWDIDAYALLPEIAKEESGELRPASNKDPLMQRLGLDDRYSVLRRQALMPSLRAVLEHMQKGRFREGCVTHVALPITVFEDANRHASRRDDEVVTLRYAVPLRVSVSGGRLRFDNMAKGDAAFQRLDDFLYLREDAEGHVPYIEVLTLALASSSFPIAFSPVRMSTCRPDARGECSFGDYRERAFIDGGSMDNAPIGLAQRLSEYIGRQPGASPYNELIYINPAHYARNLRGWLDREEDGRAKRMDVDIAGLQSYSIFLGRLLNYGMNVEYARSLRKHGMPLMPKRHFMLTADHLMHFGAFVRHDFRSFDFLLGVYDASWAYIEYVRPWMDEPPRSWEDLLQVDEDVAELFRYFDEVRQNEATPLACLPPSSEGNRYLAIARALCRATQEYGDASMFESFDRFKRMLPDAMQASIERRYRPFGTFRLAEILATRQLRIERARQAAMSAEHRGLAAQRRFTRYVGAAAWMTKTLSMRETSGRWPRNSATAWYWAYLPDELGIDGLNSVPYLQYHFALPLRALPHRSYALELGWDPYHWGRDNRNTSPYTAWSAAVKYDGERFFRSSFRLGVTAYRNWRPRIAGGRNWDYGILLGMGFVADKLQLSIIQREMAHSLSSSRFTFLVGVRDLGGLAEMMFGGD